MRARAISRGAASGRVWPLVGLLAFAGGCKDKPGASHDAGDAAHVEVAVPEGLLLKVAIHDPDAVWGRLQHGAGGALALLPPQMGAIAASVLGLDAAFVADADGHATSYAAVVAHGSEAVSWSLAMPLAGQVTATGDAGASGVWAREPGWLVVASDGAALATLGPYVTHRLPSDATLASGAPVNAIVPAAAVDGFVTSAASARWASARAWLRERARVEREEHEGRAPDFGDPDAIVSVVDAAIEAGLARLARTGDVHIEGDAGDGDLSFEATTPALDEGDGGSTAAGADPAGDGAPLASLGNATWALLLRSGLDARLTRASDASDALARIFRLDDDPSRAAVRSAFEGWARAQGDWVTLAEVPAGVGRTFTLHTPSASATASRRAAHDVVALARLPPLGRLLKGWLDLRLVKFDATASEGQATFAGSAANARSPGVAWTANDGQLSLATGNDPHAVLDAPAVSLEGPAATLVAGVGAGVTFALLARPLRLGRLGALAPSAPVLVAAGERGGTSWLRVALADSLLTEGVRLGGGLF